MHRLERRVGGVVGSGLHGVGADDRAEHADPAHEQREDDALVAEAGHAQDHRRDDRHLVALEDVGGHARAVADVVADVVRDRGRVARVVLRDVLLDLPDEVRADVGGLRVDAAADAHEERQQGTAEAEPQQRLVRVLAVDQEDHRAAEQAEAVGQHARHRARAVAELHRLAVAVHRRGRHAQVARRREPHADEADGPAEQGAHQERARAAPPERRLRAGVGQRQHDGDQRDERSQAPELRRQVGVGALADGGGDLLHLGRAAVGAVHLPVERRGVHERRERDEQHDEQGDLLDRAEPGVGEGREEPEALRRVRGLLHGGRQRAVGRLPEEGRAEPDQEDDQPPRLEAKQCGQNAAHDPTAFQGTDVFDNG